MTIPASTSVTYDLKGIREDLTDLIYNVDPTETPFLSSAKKSKAYQTKHEWQTDVLASAAQNAKIEGDAFANAAATATVRLANYTQIASKTVEVSGTDRAVRNAGRKDELGYQLMKRAKEIKRDMENDLLANTAASVGASGTARQIAGIDAWITTNGVFDATDTGANPAGDGTNGRTDATTTVALTEALLQTCLADIFTAGGNPDSIFVSAKNKQVMSGFTNSSATRFFEANTGNKTTAYHTAYDIYVSDFGQLKVVPDRFQRSRDVLVLDMEYWKIAYLRPFQTIPLAKTADADQKAMLCEYTLESCNEKASGGVFDTAG